MKPEEHKKALQEHIGNISDAVDKGIQENQRNIAFNVSQGSVELFSLFLHSLHLIEGSGDQLDHRVFKNKDLIQKKLPLEFPSKNKILDLMKEIELERTALCYGSRKPNERIENVLSKFHELRKIIKKELKNYKIS
ncbi:MAG: hypothetical protein ABIB79_05000 [archaeon]